MFRCFIINP